MGRWLLEGEIYTAPFPVHWCGLEPGRALGNEVYLRCPSVAPIPVHWCGLDLGWAAVEVNKGIKGEIN